MEHVIQWSAINCDQYRSQAQSQTFDLIIIGGGITGGGICREAALHHLSFIILDKNDFGFGTFSRSSKMAHGGFRYLSTYEFGLVRESTTERNWLMAHFPNLVCSLGFTIYSMVGSSFTPLKVKLGMSLYTSLSDSGSKFKNFKKGRLLTTAEIHANEPKFIQQGIQMGGFYYDTNVDDARLTLETIKEGLLLSQGQSVALNYTKVISFSNFDKAGKMCGVKVSDELSQDEYEIKGKQVINATGIWTDELLKDSGQKLLRPTKGSHIIIRNDRLGNNNALGVMSIDDGRFFFILRREKFTMIGTTDTDFKGDLNTPKCTQADCDYLFRTINFLFPDAHLTYQDLISTYAGVRPLVMEPGKAESQVSRKHVILDYSNGLISLIGGKLTIFRLMAEQLVHHLVKKGVITVPKSQLKKGFSKQPYKVGITWDNFVKQYHVGVQAQEYPSLDDNLIKYLHQQYGTQALKFSI